MHAPHGWDVRRELVTEKETTNKWRELLVASFSQYVNQHHNAYSFQRMLNNIYGLRLIVTYRSLGFDLVWPIRNDHRRIAPYSHRYACNSELSPADFCRFSSLPLLHRSTQADPLERGHLNAKRNLTVQQVVKINTARCPITLCVNEPISLQFPQIAPILVYYGAKFAAFIDSHYMRWTTNL